MSIAAALGTMGLAIKSLDEEKRARAIQEEQLAGMREDRAIARRTNELNFAQLADRAAQEKTQRERLNAYNQLATTAKNDEDFLTQKIAKAKELGDGEGMLAARQQLATYKAETLRRTVDGELRKFMMTGDPTALQNIYNTQVPDGNKVIVTPLNKTTVSTASAAAFGPQGKPIPGVPADAMPQAAQPQQQTSIEPMYRVQVVGPDGKIANDVQLGKDQVGFLAHQMMNPKFAEQVYIDDLKDKRELRKEEAKGRIKLNHDIQLEGYKAGREAQNIGLRGAAELEAIKGRGLEARLTAGASAAATGAQQRQTYTWKAATDAAMDGGGGSDNKELDRRVKQGRAALDKYFGISQFTGLDQNSQPQYLDALDSMNRDIRAGVDPEEAAVKAARNVRAATEAAKKTGGAKPASAYPVPDYTRGR